MTKRDLGNVLNLSVAAPILLAGCVSQSTYDAVAAQNRQLQQQIAMDAPIGSALKKQAVTSNQILAEAC